MGSVARPPIAMVGELSDGHVRAADGAVNLARLGLVCREFVAAFGALHCFTTGPEGVFASFSIPASAADQSPVNGTARSSKNATAAGFVAVTSETKRSS